LSEPARRTNVGWLLCADCGEPLTPPEGVLCIDPIDRSSCIVHGGCKEAAEFSYDITFAMLQDDGVAFWLDHLGRKLWWNPRLEADLYAFAGQP
jgi:hypothetical protein